MRAVKQLAEDLAEKIGKKLKPVPGAQSSRPTTTADDEAYWTERAWKYIIKMEDAISGQGGHDRTLAAACVCYRFGLPHSEAREVTARYNDEKCDPQWSERQCRRLARIVTERLAALDALTLAPLAVTSRPEFENYHVLLKL